MNVTCNNVSPLIHVIDMQKLLSTSGQPEEFVSAETPIRAGPSDVVILISE